MFYMYKKRTFIPSTPSSVNVGLTSVHSTKIAFNGVTNTIECCG